MALTDENDTPDRRTSNSLPGFQGNNGKKAFGGSGSPASPISSNGLRQSSRNNPTNFWRRIREFILDRRSTNIIYKKDIPESYDPSLLKQLGQSDLDTIGVFLGVTKNSKRYKEFLKRLKSGCECYAIIQKIPIAITWVYRALYQIENAKIMLRAGEALIADTCVAELGYHEIARLLEDMVAAALKQQGIKPLIFDDPRNGETPVYSIKRIKILGFSFSRIKVNPAFSPLSFR